MDQIAELLKMYKPEHVSELENIEQYFRFSSLDDSDINSFGAIVTDEGKKYGEGVALTIIRETDGQEVFRYISPDRSDRNIVFAMGKRNAVLKTGHISLWMLVNGAVNGQSVNELFHDPDTIPVGGSFPVYVNDILTYTVSVSGLHHGNDFKLIIDSMEKYLNEKIPAFTGPVM